MEFRAPACPGPVPLGSFSRALAQHAANPLALGPGRPIAQGAFRLYPPVPRGLAVCFADVDSRAFVRTLAPVIIGGIRKDDNGVYLDYIVQERQNFDQAVYCLLQLLQHAQRDYPGEPRHLRLAIEGHRLPNGDFDNEMMELQTKFLGDFLMQYLTRATISPCELNNPHPQKNEIPTTLSIFQRDNPGR